jgi:hypothetical protein
MPVHNVHGLLANPDKNSRSPSLPDHFGDTYDQIKTKTWND